MFQSVVMSGSQLAHSQYLQTLCTLAVAMLTVLCVLYVSVCCDVGLSASPQPVPPDSVYSGHSYFNCPLCFSMFQSVVMSGSQLAHSQYLQTLCTLAVAMLTVLCVLYVSVCCDVGLSASPQPVPPDSVYFGCGVVFGESSWYSTYTTPS